jgi:O-antigen ligase
MKVALKNDHYWLIGFLILLSILSAGLVSYSGKYYFAAIPFAATLSYCAFYDFRILYFILLSSIPFSIPFTIGSSNLDLPTEPLMIILLILSLIILIRNQNIDLSFLTHPITLLLFAHFVWMIFITFFSVNPLHSIKYLLSKAWYIVAFYFFTCMLLQKIEDFRKIFWFLFFPFLLFILITLVRHYKMGFTFESANYPMYPFFLNHVIYSTALIVFLPFVIFAYFNKTYNFNFFRNVTLGLGLLFFIISIGFTYTRASWLGIPIGLGVFIIVKKKLMKISLILSGLCLIILASYLLINNKFLDYAPNFQKTIFHQGDIEGHLSATYNMEDASGMERVYRWVAAKKMVEDKPFLGSGPSTFYPEYKKYTINAFYTYSSENEERSTTHNYFLLVLCEQGIIGLILFLTISMMLIITGARLYRTFPDEQHKSLAMACTISLVIFYFHLMLNDLVETDKIGSLFFITMAILVKLDLWSKNNPALRQKDQSAIPGRYQGI